MPLVPIRIGKNANGKCKILNNFIESFLNILFEAMKSKHDNLVEIYIGQSY